MTLEIIRVNFKPNFTSKHLVAVVLRVKEDYFTSVVFGFENFRVVVVVRDFANIKYQSCQALRLLTCLSTYRSMNSITY